MVAASSFSHHHPYLLLLYPYSSKASVTAANIPFANLLIYSSNNVVILNFGRHIYSSNNMGDILLKATLHNIMVDTLMLVTLLHPIEDSGGHGGVRVGGMLAGGAAAAYGEHKLSHGMPHGGGHHAGGHGVGGYYGHGSHKHGGKFKHHGKFKRGKFGKHGEHGMFGGGKFKKWK